jgi:protoporphyrinogen oxidase
MSRHVLVIGAGPAGLTASLELLRHSREYEPVIIEALDQVGGLARTVCHNGNRMDIGGHRFFSKVDWVMNWWREILPLPPEMNAFVPINDASSDLDVADALAAKAPERSLLLRPRLSRIYYLRRFFDYPITLSAKTVANLGWRRIAAVGVSYVWARLRPIKPEKNLEDFFINRFGRQLYRTFFKDYTEKVWGVKCDQISPEWGAQRIKGLSVSKAILHALKKMAQGASRDVGQKGVETSLIEKFLYPKFGPGQMWETVAEMVEQRGGRVLLSTKLVELRRSGDRIVAAVYEDLKTLQRPEMACDAVISTMAIKDLINALQPPPPAEVLRVANGLAYRDFITVGVLLAKLNPTPYVRRGFANNMFPDTWIYIQEGDVKVGRLQIFNNWSPGMVADKGQIWIGLEYFCNEGDDLWRRSEAELRTLAREELVKLNLAEASDVLDMRVLKVEKAYPAYFGSYGQFEVLRRFLDGISNLYPVGRNGMHRYNNQDHSMVSAKLAVECMCDPTRDKRSIWDVNVEQEYHEEAKTAAKKS